ncbi:hypothetical protein [Pseudomonas luteola]|uniref:hypothetical protein n=1 Tax=Pseudomonas luteola TaxID=47886 RepID=UPI000F7B601B|nr:hypothetical protein [Pseudomonas luteola]
MAIVRNRTCEHCKAPYQTSQIKSKYCSSACKSEANQLTRKSKKLSNRKLKLPSTGFYAYLLREVRRAGTVEVLTGLTSKDLSELLKLRKECNKASGFENGKVRKGKFELSHICPVQGTAFLGLLHPANLVITTVAYNRSRGVSYSGGDRYIVRSDLQNKWSVNEEMTDTQVYRMIQRFLGGELDNFLCEHNLSLTQRQTLINKLAKATLVKNGDDFDSREERAAELELIKSSLKYVKNEDLTQMAKDNDLSVYGCNMDSRSALNVAFDEMTRFESLYGVQINPTLRLYADYLFQYNQHHSRFSVRFEDDMYFLNLYNANPHNNPLAVGAEETDLGSFIALQVTRELHKERAKWVIDGKPLSNCFALPEKVTKPVVVSHPLEEMLVASYGLPPVYTNLKGWYARKESEKSIAAYNAKRVIEDAFITANSDSVSNWLSNLGWFEEDEFDVVLLSKEGNHYSALPQYEPVFYKVDPNFCPF